MTPEKRTTWGIVSTIKADARTVLTFAAYHLDLGAHRVHIYLDEPNDETFVHLKAHPKVRVTTCDDTYWRKRKRGRPAMHQVRQTMNATHAYRRIQTDWVAHIDADEFIWPMPDAGAPRVADILTSLPSSTTTLRLRPLEALAGRQDHYKSMVPPGPEREDEVRAIYPEFGSFLKGGFLSHTAGKLFARTGLQDVQFRIHNLLRDGEKVPGEAITSSLQLCHRHATSWDHWQSTYRFRLERGSYRPGLSAGFPRAMGGLSAHELLSMVEEEHGQDGLRRFFSEINAEHPRVFSELQSRNMVHHCQLDLDAKRQRHFPQFD